MIASRYVREAMAIKNSYEKLTSEINFYNDKLESIKDNISKLKLELMNYQQRNSNTHNKEANDIITQFIKIENDISKKIEPLNDKYNELVKKSDNLYNTLKEQYPHLSDEELSQELNSQIIP